MRFEFTFGEGRRPTPRDPESPFRVLVLGDFSGRRGRRPPVSERRPARVDIDTIESFLERQNAEVDLEASGAAALRVAAKELEDLHPDRLYQQLEVFAALRDTRKRLLDASTFASAAAEVRSWSGSAQTAASPPPAARASAGDDNDATLERLLGRRGSSSPSVEPAPMSAISEMIKNVVASHIVPAASADRPALVATVDAAITAAMRQVLRDPAFQALESAWRGLDFLVRQIESGEGVELFALNLTKAELLADLASAQDARESPVFRALVDRAPGAEPWALVLGLYAFDDGDSDAEALGKMALVAKAANAPFVAAAAATLVRAALDDAGRSTSSPAPNAGWAALRARPEAAFVGLVCPRFLLRLPYGRTTDPVSAFAFEEFPGPPEAEAYLWGEPAVALGVLFIQAFAASGWAMSPGHSMDLGGLPVHVRKVAHETEMTPCGEMWLSDPEAEKLLQQGLMPLQSVRGRDAVRLTRVQSIRTPPAPLGGPWA